MNLERHDGLEALFNQIGYEFQETIRGAYKFETDHNTLKPIYAEPRTEKQQVFLLTIVRGGSVRFNLGNTIR